MVEHTRSTHEPGPTPAHAPYEVQWVLALEVPTGR